MAEPRIFRRRVRRQIRGAGGSVNVAADVNAVVSTGGASSTSQTVRVVQRDGATAGTADDEGGDAARTEEER